LHSVSENRGGKRNKNQDDKASPQQEASNNAPAGAGKQETKETSSNISSVTGRMMKYNAGILGRKVNVEVNYCPLDVSQMVSKAYMHDIEIVPACSRKIAQMVFNGFAAEFFPNVCFAFDGSKIAYTKSPLDTIEGDFLAKEIEIQLQNGPPKKFQVKIQFAKIVDLQILKK
jgi:hypothetical protein